MHMAGPYWAHKDEGAWSIAKGEYDPDAEDPWAVAQREFAEEVGRPAPQGPVVDLGEHRHAQRQAGAGVRGRDRRGARVRVEQPVRDGMAAAVRAACRSSRRPMGPPGSICPRRWSRWWPVRCRSWRRSRRQCLREARWTRVPVCNCHHPRRIAHRVSQSSLPHSARTVLTCLNAIPGNFGPKTAIGGRNRPEVRRSGASRGGFGVADSMGSGCEEEDAESDPNPPGVAAARTWRPRPISPGPSPPGPRSGTSAPRPPVRGRRSERRPGS